MRFVTLALALLVAGTPCVALAKAWRGVTPGATGQDEVIEKFGEPTRKTKRDGRTVLAYTGEQALEGTTQSQFHVDAGGTVREITIFLSVPLDADTVEGTYGKPEKRTFVEDTFRKVWLYPQQGVTVYFAKEGSQVEALSFSAGAKSRAREAEAAAGPAPGAVPAAASR